MNKPVLTAAEVWADNAMPRGGVPLRPDFRTSRTQADVERVYQAIAAGALPSGIVDRTPRLAPAEAPHAAIDSVAVAELVSLVETQDKRLKRLEANIRRLREEFGALQSYTPGAA